MVNWDASTIEASIESPQWKMQESNLPKSIEIFDEISSSYECSNITTVSPSTSSPYRGCLWRELKSEDVIVPSTPTHPVPLWKKFINQPKTVLPEETTQRSLLAVLPPLTPKPKLQQKKRLIWLHNQKNIITASSCTAGGDVKLKYSPAQKKKRIQRWIEKRNRTKKVVKKIRRTAGGRFAPNYYVS